MPVAAHNLTVHTAPVYVGGGEMLLGKDSPSGSSSAGSGSGPYQVCTELSLYSVFSTWLLVKIDYVQPHLD